MSTTSRGPSRRTLVKGAAWSVPVVAVAGAAPALATSPDIPPVRPIVGQNSCKHSPNKRYHIDLTFTNDQPCETTVQITVFQVGPFSGQKVDFENVMYNFTLPAGGSLNWVYDSLEAQNMANGTVHVEYTYTDCSGVTVEEIQTISVETIPPCDFDYPHNGDDTTKSAPADVKVDEVPATTDAATTESVEPAAPVEPAPAPAAPVEPAPAPAPPVEDGATDGQNG